MSVSFNTVAGNGIEDGEEEQEEEMREEEQEEVVEQGRSDEPICIICKENPPTTVLLPCAHFGLCDDCSAEMQARHIADEPPGADDGVVVDYSICPLDRERVVQYVRVVNT